MRQKQRAGAGVPRRRDSGWNVIFGFNTDIKYGDTVYHVQSEVREHDRLLQTQVFVKGRCLGKHATSFAEQAGPDFTEDRLHDLLKAQHKHFVECARAGTIEEEIESGRGVPQQAAPTVSSAPAPLIDPLEALLSPVAATPEPPEKAEERISISVDDDLAAIAEASAAAVGETQPSAPAPPSAPMKVDEVPGEPVERPPDPVLDSFMAELAAAEKEPPPPPLPEYRVDAAGNVIGKGIGLDCLKPIVAPDGNSVLLNVQVTDEGSPCAGAQITCRIAKTSGPASYLYSTCNNNGIADVRVATQGLEPNTPILIQAAIHEKSASRKFNLRRA